MKKTSFLLFVLSLFASALSLAGTPILSRPIPQNAAPLGMEIDFAKELDVLHQYPGLGLVRVAPPDASTLCDGDLYVITHKEALGRYGIDNVSSALLCFNPQRILTLVEFIMPSDINGMFKKLKNKYPDIVSNKIDSFMNSGSAVLRKGNSSVIITENAQDPFSMILLYSDIGNMIKKGKSIEAKEKAHSANEMNNL